MRHFNPYSIDCVAIRQTLQKLLHFFLRAFVAADISANADLRVYEYL